MAEGKIEEEPLMVCPYFLHSSCSYGENCQFTHDLTGIPPKNVMCEWFQRGMCKYGNKCWLSHNTEIKSDSQSTKEHAEDDRSKIKMRYSFRHRRTPKNPSNDVPLSPELLDLISDMKKSYADVLKSNNGLEAKKSEKLPVEMCMHFEFGYCLLNNQCPCIHGKFCELCQKYCLDPSDWEQQRKHKLSCEKELERDMELSFAIQCSKDKTCGICLEVVFEKELAAERRFGILENCNHVFCLSCIRQWRQRKTVETLQDAVIDKRATRACPQCRVPSDFVTPSIYWFESDENKLEIVSNYKKILKSKHCKYFKHGDGTCPFGGYCFYLHAKPDGTVVELAPPSRRLRHNQDGEIDLIDDVLLWNYFENRDEYMFENFTEAEFTEALAGIRFSDFLISDEQEESYM